MSFLGKIQGVKAREKDRIKIDIQQIIKIFLVLAGKGIRGPVTAGKRVHKRIERAPDHHKEWVAHRILLTATERRVLQNMSHTSRVHRHSAQRHQKYILLVVGSQMDMLGASHAMAKLLIANF